MSYWTNQIAPKFLQSIDYLRHRTSIQKWGDIHQYSGLSTVLQHHTSPHQYHNTRCHRYNIAAFLPLDMNTLVLTLRPN